MPIYLTQLQIDQITALKNAGPNEQGNYSHIYKFIGDLLPEGDQKNWFRGAEQANAGQGVYSAMIRAYSKRQLELRGVAYSEALMQAASNQVAIRALNDVLDVSGTFQRKEADGRWRFPTMEEIAGNDATGVGEVLFGALPAGDTALPPTNAGWSGTILFSGLNSPQSWRLVSAGSGSAPDRLDDLKNLLFAYDSFRVGMIAAANVFALELATASLRIPISQQFWTDVGIGFDTFYNASTDARDALLLQRLTAILPPSAQSLGRFVEAAGISPVLDMLRRTWLGAGDPGETTDANFVSRAENLFSGISANTLQSTSITYLGDVVGLAELAKTDIAVRNALWALSPIAISLPDYSGRCLELYDPETGRGDISEWWLYDRAAMLNDMVSAYTNHTGSGKNLWVETHDTAPNYYKDLATGIAVQETNVVTGTVDGGATVQFGSDASDIITGVADRDRMYGGCGNDTLNGGAGSDYLEGGDGDDVIDGGQGYDFLFGGEGHDALAGGTDGAWLQGGLGFDIYNADDDDAILDTDGQGAVFLNGVELRGGYRQEGTTSTYRDDFGNVYETDGTTLWVDGMPLGSKLSIGGFINGDLGIWLDEEQRGPAGPYDPNDPNDPNNPSNPNSPNNPNNPNNPRGSKNPWDPNYRGGPFSSDPLETDGPGGMPPLSTSDSPEVNDPFDHGADYQGDPQPRVSLTRLDPLTLDLDGDGIETVGIDLDSPIYFDHRATGIKIATGWVSPDDGLLVLDRNANGTIDDGSELFGDNTPLASGISAADGFAALAEQDTNSDGVVNALDTSWSGLRVWRDLNQDAISQATELVDLTAAGIAEIRVAKTESVSLFDNGNVLADFGTFLRTDGTSGSISTSHQVADVDLVVNPFYSQFTDSIPVSLEAAALPNMRGSGAVRSMWEAATLSTGFRTALSAYSSASTKEQQLALLDDLITQWAATTTLETTSQTTQLFTRRWGVDSGSPTLRFTPTDTPIAIGSQQHNELIALLSVVEAFNGRVLPEHSFWTGQIDLLQRSKDELKTIVYENLLPQTRLKPYLQALFPAVAPGQTPFDFEAMNALLAAKMSAEPSAGLGDWYDLFRYESGRLSELGWNGLQFLMNAASAAPEVFSAATLAQAGITISSGGNVTGTGLAEILVGTAQGETIRGQGGDDVLLGEAGNDNLAGDAGDDSLSGGAGNDTLAGGVGNDTYYFARGGGSDVILENDSTPNNRDAIRFVDLNASDILMSRSVSAGRPGNDLLISIKGSGDTLTVRDFFSDSRFEIEEFQFGNRSTLASAELGPLPLLADSATFAGTAGNDIIDLRNAVNTTAYGSYVNNNYYGADDGHGNDTYIFGAGAGQDTIREKDATAGNIDTVKIVGKLPSEVTLSRRLGSYGEPTGDLVISLVGTTDTLTVAGHFDDPKYKVERVVFDDGTVWTSAELDSLPLVATTGTIRGTEGNDIIDLRNAVNTTAYGSYVNNNYYGADDGHGNDTYIFGAGAGQDTIREKDATAGNIDTVKIVGKLPSEVTLSRRIDSYGQTTGDLVISLNGTTDTLTVVGHFTDAKAKVEQVVFDDGTVWAAAELDSLPLVATGATINGTEGNDIIDLRNAVNTTAYGSYVANNYWNSDDGHGNDTYIFGAGAGQDTIREKDSTAGNIDTVKIVGKLPSEVTLVRSIDTYGNPGGDLIVTLAGVNDTLKIEGHFADDKYKIEQIVFDDGTIWSGPDLVLATIRPTTSSPVNGTAGNDTFDLRNPVNSTVYGLTSSAVDSGDDTYLFGAGSGQDTITDFASGTGSLDTIKVRGVSPSAVSFYREVTATNGGADLVIAINGTQDRLTVKKFFDGENYRVEKVQFDDGTVWTGAELANAVTLPTWAGPINGSSGADTVDLRHASNTTVYGYLNSATDSGNDTYLFGAGAGQDTISDYGTSVGNVDTIRILGTPPSGVTMQRSIAGSSVSDDLVFLIDGTADRLTVKNYFAGDANKIERVEFVDGTVWTASELAAAVVKPTVAGTVTGSLDSDTFDLRASVNNTVYGSSPGHNSGNDTYVFGAGAGQDTIIESNVDAGDIDTIQLVGQLPSNVSLSRRVDINGNLTNDLQLKIIGSADSLIVQDYFASAGNRVERVAFDDGTVWTSVELDAAAALVTTQMISGTSGADRFDLTSAINTVAYGYVDYAGYDSGNDTYVFGAGAGQDTISDRGYAVGNIDTVRIVGALPSQVAISRTVSGSSLGNDLVLSISGTADTLTIRDYFQSDVYKIEKVEFDDGTVWTPAELNQAAGVITTSTTVYGTSGGDAFDLRNAANTIVYGASPGYDSGNDSYIFGAGSGQDTINDYATSGSSVDTIKIVGRLPSEVTLKREIIGSNVSNDLLIMLNGTTDTLCIQNYFAGSAYKIEKVQFDDGTIWGPAELDLAPITPTTATTVSGSSLADVFDLRNAANSTVNGGPAGYDSGADTYVFGVGAGQDVISDYGTTAGHLDSIRIIGKQPSEVSVSRSVNGSSLGSDLIISINGTTDKLTVTNYFAGTSYKIEKVQFDDGTIWDTTVLDAALVLPTIAGTLYGSTGADAIDLRNSVATVVYGPGGGNNTGNDIYVFGAGAGQDTINDYDTTAGNLDTIKIIGKLPSEVSVSRGVSGTSVSNDLVISINGTTDKLTVTNYFAGTSYKVEKVQFDDGTIWDTTVLDAALVLPTVAGALYGSAGADAIDLRNSVATVVYGPGGGNNTGNDTYVFGAGAGQDSINDYDTTAGNFDTIKIIGKLPSEVTVSRGVSGTSVSNDMVISINGTTDKLTVTNYFAGASYKIEKVQFDDGTIWDTTVLDVALALPTVAGTLYATSGADAIDLRNAVATSVNGPGGSSNTGNDTYVFGAGAGQDTINDYDTTAGNIDTIKIVGKLPSEVSVSRGVSGTSVSNDLVISINGTSDKLTVTNYFAGASYKIENIQFDNGTTWDTTVLDAALVLPTVAGTLYATAGADAIDLRNSVATSVNGPGGSSNTGNDTYVFGAGAGQDTINDYDTTAGNIDTIKIVGKLPSDVSLSRAISGSNLSNDLVISINGTTDKLTITNYFANAYYKIEKLQFDNGTIWGTAELDQALAVPTGTATVYGTNASDGYDLRNAANSTVYGGQSGYDSGADTYVFAAGSGQDVINDYGTTAGQVDTIKIVGKLPSEVGLSRGISGSNLSNDLVISINGTTDKVTVQNYFYGTNYKIEQVQFDNGTIWGTTELDQALAVPTGTATVYGTNASDGYDLRNAANSTVYGGQSGYDSGADTYVFEAGSGQDVINDYGTTAGHVDTIKIVGKLPSEVNLSRAISGANLSNDLVISINGTTDKLTVQNYFYGTNYKIEQVQFDNGTTWGTAELDQALAVPTGTATVYGTNASDGYDLRNAANSTVYGGQSGYDSGADTYVFAAGSGQDVINDYGATAGHVDTIKIVGKLPSEVSLSRGISGSNLSNDLVISINGTTDKLTVQNYFYGTYYKIEQVQFDNGTIWGTTELDQALAIPTGASTVYGTTSSDGFDLRNAANSSVYGASSGYDSGADTYVFGVGAGQDSIADYGTTAGHTDLLKLDGAIASDQVWFKHVGNNLEVSVIGTADKVTIQNWYSGGSYHVEQIRAGDNKLLLDTQVEALVQAMAAFAPPSAGQTTLPPEYQTALAPVLAANWQ